MKLKGVLVLFFGLALIIFFFMLIVRSCSSSKSSKSIVPISDQKRWLMTTSELLDLKTTSEADTVAKQFKASQNSNARVKRAYKEKFEKLKKLLNKKEILSSKIDIYIIIYKKEQLLEVWGKEKIAKKYKFLKSYPICKSSGNLGPKRKEGDKQTPEGFYKIIHFNPLSKYEFSLKLNYPNKSDVILGDKENPGGDIYIQGGCTSVGGIPVQNKNIKEIFVLGIEAKASAKKSNIPVTIYPAKMTDENYEALVDSFKEDEETLKLWKSLKKGFDFFQKCKELPNIIFAKDGSYIIRGKCN